LLTGNRAYYPRRQNAVATWQGHVSHPLTHRSWLAFDGTWFVGGQTRVNRIAGAATRRGSAFNTLNVTWQVVSF
jgi:hypothetical protein